MVTPSSLEHVVATWDRCVAGILTGEDPPPMALDAWFGSLRSSYATPAVTGALPEPFLGRLDRRPAGVFLTATPGRAFIGSHGRPDFQSRTGVFAQEMHKLGSYAVLPLSAAAMDFCGVEERHPPATTPVLAPLAWR
jgi:hypothetical protein